jgi:histidinol-phosphate aminotransferase
MLFCRHCWHDLNQHNDSYPLARASQAAALATLKHEDKIRDRAAKLRGWAADLAQGLRELNVRTYPSETYFFLADFSPYDASLLAERLKEHEILVKPLNDTRLGPGFMRITTSLPEDNARFLAAIREVLSNV